jgi:hypothetical protein
MASTNFVDNSTVIYAAWLNDVNNATYNGIFAANTITPSNIICNGTVSGSGFTSLVANVFASPAPIGNGTPNTGKFTTLTATTPISVSSGGTGVSSLSVNNVLLGNGTSSFQVVAPGTTGNVLKSNGTTWISSQLKGLGLGGEVWNTVTSSRAFNTTYTNSYSYPIMVSASTNAMGGSQQLLGYVNGQLVNFWKWQFNGAGAVGGVSMIVPPGATYSCNTDNGVGVQNWVELY